MPVNLLRLEVVSGPMKGQVLPVSDHRSAVIGRLPDCDLAFLQDPTVSREHFRIEFDAPRCWLIHLSQTSETYVNGRPVSNAELQDGDKIELGEENTIRITFEEVRDSLAAPTDPGAKGRRGPANCFTSTRATCGWNLYESESEDLGFEQLFEILLRTEPVMALIDVQRIGEALPEGSAEVDFLFSWMAPTIRGQFSPILGSASYDAAIAGLVRTGWGKDGIVCFGSNLTTNDSLAHWKSAIGVRDETPGKGMTAYHWPSILDLILTCQSPDNTNRLLNELSWVFIEAPKSPGNWRLFTKSPYDKELTMSGLEAVEPAAAAK